MAWTGSLRRMGMSISPMGCDEARRLTWPAGLRGFAALHSSAVCHGRFNKETPSVWVDNDPYGLVRFVDKQREWFPVAMQELREGQRRTKWQWYLFPTPPHIAQVSEKETGCRLNREYSLRDLPPNSLRGVDAAKALLRYPTTNGVNLRANLLATIATIREESHDKGRHLVRLLGLYEARMFISCLQHFRDVTAGGVDPEVHAACRDMLEQQADVDRFDDGTDGRVARLTPVEPKSPGPPAP